MTTKTNETSTLEPERLEASLIEFYSEEAAWAQVLPFIDPERQAPISLRLLDYFVVTYARAHDTNYVIVDCEANDVPFYVNSQYCTQLKRYTKSRFDPFCRGTKRNFRGHQTNTKQLNFFRWAILHHVLTYAIDHLDEITMAHRADMLLAKSAPPQKRRRMMEAQRGTYVRCFVYGPDSRITIEFESTRSVKTFAPGEVPGWSADREIMNASV